jgi:uncharacterized protein (TIGR02996 family)
MDDGNLLLSALHARPADGLAWLAFADWLEESGRPGPAELTRLLTLIRQSRDGARQRHEQQFRDLLASGVRPVVPTIVNSVGMTFALIPPGNFLMGSPKDEDGRFPDETPLHPVTLTSAYYLGVHPVTQAQYRQVMGHNPSYFVRVGEAADSADELGSTDDFPVESVSWEDAVAFCKRLGGKVAERRAKRSYRLPSEAEWEYACRGGIYTPTPYHFGNQLSPELARYNFEESPAFQNDPSVVYQPYPCAVGTFPPNAYGLFGMHGNVWEFCQDWFDADHYDQRESVDPTGPPEGDSRVLRGGSWYSRAAVCRSACRNPLANENTAGFRVVLRVG